MEEARASWNTIYLDKQGFECQLTLRDDDENALAERVGTVMKRIQDSGGKPVVRRNGNGNGNGGSPQNNSGGAKQGQGSQQQEEKTYVDDKGTRRCNLNLKNGRRCNHPVTEKEGRYGLFWSCPDYKNHG